MPRIGITCDTLFNVPPTRCAALPGTNTKRVRYQLPRDYVDAVARCGAQPIILPPHIDQLDAMLELCDGIMLIGGDDPSYPRGQRDHPHCQYVDPLIEDYLYALLAKLDDRPTPVLGICLGMQMIGLHRGATLVEHLPEHGNPLTAAPHLQGYHPLTITAANIWRSTLGEPPDPQARCYSAHHQAMDDPGQLSVLATGPGDVVEAVFDGAAPRWRIGVQWHAELTEDPTLGCGVIRRLVDESSTDA